MHVQVLCLRYGVLSFVADCAHLFGSLKSEPWVLQSFYASLLNQTEYSNHMEIQTHTENHAVCTKEQYS